MSRTETSTSARGRSFSLAKRGFVRAQGLLAVGATVDEVEDHPRQPGAGTAPQVLDRRLAAGHLSRPPAVVLDSWRRARRVVWLGMGLGPRGRRGTS